MMTRSAEESIHNFLTHSSQILRLEKTPQQGVVMPCYVAPFRFAATTSLLLSLAFSEAALAYDLEDENPIIAEDITYTHYDVGGSTLAEIEADLNAKGPVDAGGQRRWSDTEYAVQADENCTYVGLTVKVTLPRLDPNWSRDLSFEDELIFDRMFAALLNHEMRHVDAARHLAEVTKLFDCADLPPAFIDYAETAEARLDERSDHGRRNGINLDSTWEGPLGDLPRSDDLIKEDVIYEYYEVGGRDLTDILIAMREDGPNGFWGYTRTQNFKKPQSCDTRLHASLTMPQLSEDAKPIFSKAEHLEFKRMYVALHSHELRHIDNGRRYSALVKLFRCPKASHPFYGFYNSVQKRLDVRSQNGQRQGVYLDVEVSEKSRSWLEWIFGK